MAWVIGIGIFLFLLFAFPRAMVGLIVLCGVVIGGFLLWTKMEDDKIAKKRASVSVTVDHNVDLCSPDYPLFVRILNSSNDTVEKVSFDIIGRFPGHSDPLYDSGYRGYSSDRIIASGDGWASCWTLPKQAYGVSEESIALGPPDTLVWAVTRVTPRFRGS